MKIQRIAFALN